MSSTIYQLYMNELKNGLKEFDPAFTADILEDFEEHFAAGRSRGMSDEEICMELGPADEIIASIRQEFQAIEEEKQQAFSGQAPEPAAVLPLSAEQHATEPEPSHVEAPVPYHVSDSEAPIRRMEIRLHNAAAVMLPGNSDQVEYEYSGDFDETRFEIYVDGDTFHLNERVIPQFWKGIFQFRGLTRQDRFTFWVPSTVQEIMHSTSNGSCSFQNLELTHLDASARNGSIRVSSLTADTCTLNSVNGSLKVTQVPHLARLEAGSTNASIQVSGDCGTALLSNINGSITFTGTAAELLSATSVNGSVSLTYTQPEHGSSIDASTTSGKVHTFVNHSEYPAKKALRLQIGDGALQIKANTVNGKITIKDQTSSDAASHNTSNAPHSAATEFAPEQISSVKVSWHLGQITIASDAGKTIRVLCDREDSGMTCTCNGDRLRIKSPDSTPENLAALGNLFRKDLETESCNLTILFPNTPGDSLKTLRIESATSQVSISDVSPTEKLSIENVSGDITLERVATDKLKIESVNGNIQGNDLLVRQKLHTDTANSTLTLSGSIASLSHESLNGNLTLQSDICPEKISTETILGNIALELPKESGFTYDMDSLSGHLTCEWDGASSGCDGRHGRIGDGRSSFSFQTVSGSITIRQH